MNKGNGKYEVLHVIDSLEVGGAERLLLDVVNGLTGFNHHVISLSDRATLKDSLQPGTRFLSLGFRSKRDTLRCIRRLRKYIRENNISLVHSHLVMANIIARLGTPRAVPVFNTLHTLGGARFFSGKGGWRKWLEKFSYRPRHHIIAVSKEVLKDYEESIGLKGRSTVLYNFVDDKFFVEKPHVFTPGNGLRAVAVGTLKPAKNFQFLVEAFRNLPPGISLDIYGDGPLRDELERLIEDSRVNVRLCGGTKDIDQVLAGYDIFLMSSLFEGHPVALVEAMAAGLPALVSDIPVLREASGGKGLFFTQGNIGEFARMIKDIEAGKIDINVYAAHNLQFANEIGRRTLYLQKLTSLYLDAIKKTRHEIQ